MYWRSLGTSTRRPTGRLLELSRAVVEPVLEGVGHGDELGVRVGRERLLRRAGASAAAADQADLEASLPAAWAFGISSIWLAAATASTPAADCFTNVRRVVLGSRIGNAPRIKGTWREVEVGLRSHILPCLWRRDNWRVARANRWVRPRPHWGGG